MTRCQEFYERWERTPNWCAKCERSVRLIDGYMSLVNELQELGCSKDLTYKLMTERVARPIIGIKDNQIRAKLLSSIADAIGRNQKLSPKDVKKFVSASQNQSTESDPDAIGLGSQHQASDQKPEFLISDTMTAGVTVVIAENNGSMDPHNASWPLDIESESSSSDNSSDRAPGGSAIPHSAAGNEIPLHAESVNDDAGTLLDSGAVCLEASPTSLQNTNSIPPRPWVIPSRELTEREWIEYFAEFVQTACTSEQQSLIQALLARGKFENELAIIDYALTLVGGLVQYEESFNHPSDGFSLPTRKYNLPIEIFDPVFRTSFTAVRDGPMVNPGLPFVFAISVDLVYPIHRPGGF